MPSASSRPAPIAEVPVDSHLSDDLTARVRAFVHARTRDADLDDDTNMFEAGVVNSLFAMELVLFVEASFRLEVTTDDLDLENFKSISAVSSFVRRKTAAAGAPGP